MKNEEFAELVREKDWVADDDHIVAHDDEYETFVWWSTDSYIANTQMEALMADEDVSLGVIDPGGEDDKRPFKIAVYSAGWVE